MKTKIIILLSLISAMWFVYCAKDVEEPPQIVQAITHHESDPDLFASEVLKSSANRDGRKPFDFIGSQVLFNPFSPGVDMIAYNIVKMDSAVYDRIDNGGANYNGTMWGNYYIKKYFKDGTIESIKAYAPQGSIHYVVIPDLVYNQLDESNIYNRVKVVREAKSEWYLDHKCGKMKRRYYYNVTTPDTTVLNTIDGDRCGPNTFLYKLIN